MNVICGLLITWLFYRMSSGLQHAIDEEVESHAPPEVAAHTTIPIYPIRGEVGQDSFFQ